MIIAELSIILAKLLLITDMTPVTFACNVI